eukprot:COSAG01_NODE_12679_length_1700_cov_53.963148_2_plen_191_part_00
MAESFSTRVRGVGVAPITGWQSAPMLPLTQVSKHTHKPCPPAHSWRVQWARGVCIYSVAPPPVTQLLCSMARVQPLTCPAHFACGVALIRPPRGVLCTPSSCIAADTAAASGQPVGRVGPPSPPGRRAPRVFRDNAFSGPRAVRLTVEASSFLAPPPFIHIPRGGWRQGAASACPAGRACLGARGSRHTS